MATNTNLDDFLKQKKLEKRGEWEEYVFGLINAGDPEIISFIEKNHFLVPIYDKTISVKKVEEILELSARIPIKLKRKLRTILLLHKPEIIDQLQSMYFSFDSDSFRGS